MNETMSKKLELFIENSQIAKREFKWDFDQCRRLIALLYARENRQIDCDAIKDARKLIKQQAGVFSSFRGNMSLFFAALLSLSNEPETLLGKTIDVFNMLRQEKLRNSDFLVIAAYEIAAQTEPTRFYDIVRRTVDFYNGLLQRRFLLSVQDDYVFAAMLGLSDIDVSCGLQRVESIYHRLWGEFKGKNSVQNMAQVLVLGGLDIVCTDRVLGLRDAFRKQHIKLDKPHTLSSLGVLAMLPIDIETIVSDVDDVQKKLRQSKGFGRWTVSTHELLLFATAIVGGDYARQLSDDTLSATLATNIANIIIAQQAAMMASIIAVVATTQAATVAAAC